MCTLFNKWFKKEKRGLICLFLQLNNMSNLLTHCLSYIPMGVASYVAQGTLAGSGTEPPRATRSNGLMG